MANEKRLDLIDRSSLGIGKAKREAFDNPAYADGWNSAIAIIENAPTVDAVEVVHGRWNTTCLTGGFAEEWGYVCSECGCTVSERSRLGKQQLNYCPNCGAKMDGGNEDVV